MWEDTWKFPTWYVDASQMVNQPFRERTESRSQQVREDFGIFRRHLSGSGPILISGRIDLMRQSIFFVSYMLLGTNIEKYLQAVLFSSRY